MPMDHSAVVAFVDQHGKELARQLGIGHWTRVFKFGTIMDADASVVGRCTVDVDYERATIEIEPAGIQDEEHLAQVLYHELAHIVGAPFDLLYQTIAQTATPEQAQTWGRLNRWAHEQFVITMERAFSARGESADDEDTPAADPNWPASEPGCPGCLRHQKNWTQHRLEISAAFGNANPEFCLAGVADKIQALRDRKEGSR